MKTTKSFASICKIDENELKLINKFTTRTLTADEIYAFSVVLCDNEIDRDFERFTPEALQALAKMFVGKPGIFDHSMKGKDQIARTYSCTVESTGELTSDGLPYVRLKAKAYVAKTSKTEDFILNLQAGIFKEVSVGCAVEKQICSVCGKDKRHFHCEHLAGEFYTKGETPTQCHTLLVNPVDAYEWSFVAVPAQRRAGVVKAYNKKQGVDFMTFDETVKNLSDGKSVLSKEESKLLVQEFTRLKSIEDEYLSDLKKSVVKDCAIALPKLSGEELDKILNSLSPTLIKAFGSAVAEKRLSTPQLHKNTTAKKADNNEFVI